MELAVVAGLLGTLVVALVHGATRGGHRRPPPQPPPRHSIADVRDGERTSIVGRIVEAPPLVAPLTRRPCVWFDVATLRADRSGGLRTVIDLLALSQGSRVRFAGRSTWRKVSGNTRCVTFVIEDASGHADVDPTGAEITVEPTQRAGGASATGDDRSSGRYMRVQRALEIGEWIVVTGVATREPDPDGAARATGYRDTPLRPRFAGSPAAPLEIRHAELHERPEHARFGR